MPNASYESLETLIKAIDPDPEGRIFDGSWPQPCPLSRALDGMVGSILQRNDYNRETPDSFESLLASYTDQHFDLILAWSPPVLNNDPDTVIQPLKRVLKSGGRLFLAIPLAESNTEGFPGQSDWQRSMHAERLWVDWNEIVTQNTAGTEYMKHRSSASFSDENNLSAIATPDCYLYLSGIK